MYIYNTNTIAIEKIKNKDLQEIEFTFGVPNILNTKYTDYIESFKYSASKILEGVADKPTLFRIRLETTNTITEEDFDHFYVCFIAMFVEALTEDKQPREREKRLAANIDGLNINYTTLMKIINFNCKVNSFNVFFSMGDYITSLV